MIYFPKSSQDATTLQGEFRAGGTDLQERRHLGISPGNLIDLRDIPGLDKIEGLEVAPGMMSAVPGAAPSTSGTGQATGAGTKTPASKPGVMPAVKAVGKPASAQAPAAPALPAPRVGPEAGGLRLGAKVVLATLAQDARVKQHYPALAITAGGLATPEIRAAATLGGSLLQRVRCWYYRNPGFECLKKGGATCFARQGDHHYHACIDLGPCIAPHPSSMGMALLAYDAEVEVQGAPGRTMAQLLGDGKDARRENTLEPQALVTSVLLPAPWVGEKSAYFRAISRARAEWPLVEVVVRLKVDSNIVDARVAVGGVANIPLRLPKVEQALIGKSVSAATLPETLKAAAALAWDGTRALPMTEYKGELLVSTVLETLERALQGGV